MTPQDELRERLERSFGELVRWSRADPERLERSTDGWNGREILEHVALANHYLLILVEKIRDRARAKLRRGEPWPRGATDLERVAAAVPGPWAHPDHMTPTGDAAPAESARRLEEQLARCLACLDEMPDGQGTLHRIRMSRVDARLDLYEYLELVARHAERHVAQIERVAG